MLRIKADRMNKSEEMKMCKEICLGKGKSCKKWCVNFTHQLDCERARNNIIAEHNKKIEIRRIKADMVEEVESENLRNNRDDGTAYKMQSM